MRRLFLLFCFLLFCYTLVAQSSRVLFLGNSYTYANNLPQLVQQCFQSVGDDVIVNMSTSGGLTFQQHCTFSLGFIMSGDYDIVVLQEQSQLPSFPESQFMQESYPYAQQLCDLIHQYNPNAKIYFYMTWGRKNGDAQNCQFFPPLCTYEGMDSLLYDRYLMMAADNQACVSPVGAVWHYIRDHYPDMELYQSDESHPSYFGSYVAACCFYTSITGQNPCDIQWNGTLTGYEADIAKLATKKVIYDSLSKWCFMENPIEEDSTSIAILSGLNPVIDIYPNPSSHCVYLKSEEPLVDIVLEIYDMAGRLITRYDQFNGDTFDVSTFKNGLYFLKVHFSDYCFQTRFYVVH